MQPARPASPLDWPNDTPQSSSTAAICKRLPRSLAGHGLFAPGARRLTLSRSAAQPLSIEQLRTKLPQGSCIEITARAHLLNRESAQLKSMRLADPRGVSVISMFAPDAQFSLARSVFFRHVKAGTKLQIAMDTGVRLTLEVIAALDLASGGIREFEFRDFAK